MICQHKNQQKSHMDFAFLQRAFDANIQDNTQLFFRGSLKTKGTCDAGDFLVQMIDFLESMNNKSLSYAKDYFIDCLLDNKIPTNDEISKIEFYLEEMVDSDAENISKSKYSFLKDKLSMLKEYKSKISQGDLVFQKTSRAKNFEKNFCLHLLNFYSKEMNFILNDFIEKMMESKEYFDAFQDKGSIEKTYSGSYESNKYLSEHFRNSSICQKMTFIYDVVLNSKKENEKKDHQAHGLKQGNSIEIHSARGGKVSDPPLTKSVSLPQNFISQPEGWIEGGKKHEVNKHCLYYKILERQGRHYVTGASRHTVSYANLWSTVMGETRSSREQTMFLGAVMCYLVLGGHHSLNETCESLYYHFSSQKQWSGVFEKIHSKNESLLPTLFQLHFNHSQMSQVLRTVYSSLEEFSYILEKSWKEA